MNEEALAAFWQRISNEEAPAKPAHGAACNACGRCCKAARCPLGAAVFGPGPDCPALQWDRSCGLVRDPHAFTSSRAMPSEALSRSAALLIGAGLGCDAAIEGEPTDRAFSVRLIEYVAQHTKKIRRARWLWSRAGIPRREAN